MPACASGPLLSEPLWGGHKMWDLGHRPEGPSSPPVTNCLEGSKKEKQVEFPVPYVNSGQGLREVIFTYLTNALGLPTLRQGSRED